MDIPDSVYRRLKAHTAARGLSVREVMLELVEQWLQESDAAGDAAPTAASGISNQEKAARLRAFLDQAADLVAGTSGPALEQLVDQGRRRLDTP